MMHAFRRACWLLSAAGGVGAYCYGSQTTKYSAKCDSNDGTEEQTPPFAADTLYPSFKAILLKKLYYFDFSELRRPEVLIEIGLISIPLALTSIASARYVFHHKRSWHRKDFYHLMNVSLNTVIRTPVAGGSYKYTLYFRTLMEKELKDVISNEEGIKQLIDAAKRTNTQDPFIRIKNDKHHWTICNQIANKISAMCANSFLHRDIVYHNFVNSKEYESQQGEEDLDELMDSCVSGRFLSTIKGKNGVNLASNIESGVYLMALTCEPEQSLRNRKIRVLLIQERTIQQLLHDMNTNMQPEQEWQAMLEAPVHVDRWELIKKMVLVYDAQEKKATGKIKWAKPLCDLELCTISLSDNTAELMQYLQTQQAKKVNA